MVSSEDILTLSFYNNLASDVSSYAYVVGKDINDRVVILQNDGTFYHPNVKDAVSPLEIRQDVRLPLGPLGSTISINLPTYISSARIYVALGELRFYISGDNSLVEPSPFNPLDSGAIVNWGFVELTHNTNGVWANISCVDFVGTPLGISLTSRVGTVQTSNGLTANAVETICNDLYVQSLKDGQPWDKLCQKSTTGAPIRVIAPVKYIDANPNAFKSYWTDYINQVWLTYTSVPLTIDTQISKGKVQCQVVGDVLECAGDNRSYTKPTAVDIFGCNTGPFEILAFDNDIHRAVVPRLCAAINRSTLLINDGNVQPSLPSSSYYSTSPTNHYSRIVHEYEFEGKGYAFPYDDVNPATDDQSGTISSPNPLILAIKVGGA